MLALGIGANTAVFSLIHRLLFARPGYAQPDERVPIFSQDVKKPKSFRSFSYATLNDIRAQDCVFSGVAGLNVSLAGIGEKNNTRRTFASIVTANYFTLTPREFYPSCPAFSHGSFLRMASAIIFRLSPCPANSFASCSLSLRSRM